MAFPAFIFAQQKVSGTVTDELGKSLPGVNVTIEGTLVGTTTDENGKYTINASQGDVLVFQFIGYQAIEEEFTGSQTLNVSLKQDVLGLEEIVVVGHGTSTRKEVTGSNDR
jgi:hypothetical protein